MRLWSGLMCCLALLAGDVAQLRRLQEKDRIFELREALQQPGWNDSETLFYRAITEARLGREREAIGDLREFLAARPSGELERQGNEELASALVRLGRYGEAARVWTAALRLTPLKDAERRGTENTRLLYESLSDVPAQSVRFDGEAATIQAKHNSLGSWDVPVEANGRQGQWIFDTGANLSTLSEAEAVRMGLSLRETAAYVRGSTDKKNRMRLAVAPDLQLGTAHVSNVVFLVLSDEALFIGPLKYQIRGILGLPVIRDLGKLGISADGLLRIGGNNARESAEANLFFADSDPIVDLRHRNHRLQMFLDTGANTTVLYRSFRDTLTSEEIGTLKRKTEKRGGAGGVVREVTEVVPTFRFEILGRAVDLQNISLFRKQPAGHQRYRDGVLGMDALSSGFTLDFGAMQLRLN